LASPRWTAREQPDALTTRIRAGLQLTSLEDVVGSFRELGRRQGLRTWNGLGKLRLHVHRDVLPNGECPLNAPRPMQSHQRCDEQAIPTVENDVCGCNVDA
jgi:hypothetical protein